MSYKRKSFQDVQRKTGTGKKVRSLHKKEKLSPSVAWENFYGMDSDTIEGIKRSGKVVFYGVITDDIY